MNLRASLVLISLAALVGCVHVSEPRENRITGQPNESRTKVEKPAARLVLAPVNLVPNIASNFIVGLYPGNIWPIQYLLLPFSAVVWGIQDTYLGYLFWSPSALYE